MLKREVTFTLTADGGVMPTVPQFGGVKGEHNATKLIVSLANGVYTDGDVVRLSFTTGDGTVLSSDLIDCTVSETETVFKYELPQLLTIAAGQLCVRVVLSHIDENGDEIYTYRSPEMVLYFDEAGVENGTPFWTGVSEMLKRTASVGTTATQAADEAKSAKQSAISAATAATLARDKAKQYAQVIGDEMEKAQQAAADAQASAESAWEAVITPGRQGLSAYDVAVKNGFEGTEKEWLKSLMAEGMRYRGEMSGTEMMGLADARYGDVVFNTTTGDYFSYGKDGNWKAFSLLQNLLRYKGEATKAWLGALTAKAVGDTYYIPVDNAFYMWNGDGWKLLGNGGDGDGGTVTDEQIAEAIAVYFDNNPIPEDTSKLTFSETVPSGIYRDNFPPTMFVDGISYDGLFGGYKVPQLAYDGVLYRLLTDAYLEDIKFALDTLGGGGSGAWKLAAEAKTTERVNAISLDVSAIPTLVDGMGFRMIVTVPNLPSGESGEYKGTLTMDGRTIVSTPLTVNPSNWGMLIVDGVLMHIGQQVAYNPYEDFTFLGYCATAVTGVSSSVKWCHFKVQPEPQQFKIDFGENLFPVGTKVRIEYQEVAGGVTNENP